MEQKILIYTNHYDPEYFKINDIVKWLYEEDATISVITGNPNYPSGKLADGFSIFGSKKVIKKGLTIYRLPLITRGKAGTFRLSLNYISYFLSSIFFTCWCIFFHKKYDTIFIHHTSPPLLFFPAILYKKVKKSKLILWDLDMWPHTLEAIGVVKSKILFKTLEHIFKFLYKSFDKVLIASKSFENIAKKRIMASKIEYFPNWADQEFEDLNIDMVAPKNNDKIIITYAGNIGQAQGFDILIEAINKSKNKNIQFNFIGSGRYKEKLKKLVSDYNLESKVLFFDPVSSKNLIPFFINSNYLFLSLINSPIFLKTVPAKLQTYLAIGKPIISSISGEATDLLIENKCGFHVEAEDELGLINIFQNLDKVKSFEYKEFSQNSKKLYQHKFSSQKRKKELITYFNLKT